jgi:hypothetical protein
MMKRAIATFVVAMAVVLQTGFGTEADSLDDLRIRMRGAQLATVDEAYAAGSSAYAQLMAMGERGFEVVSECWVRDLVPDENWLGWQYDLVHVEAADAKAANAKRLQAYQLYFARKLEKEPDFAEAVMARVVASRFNDAYGLNLMRASTVTARQVGYEAIKRLHPDIPAFDASAGEPVRLAALAAISSALGQ